MAVDEAILEEAGMRMALGLEAATVDIESA
jgi:hypothetical protein